MALLFATPCHYVLETVFNVDLMVLFKGFHLRVYIFVYFDCR